MNDHPPNDPPREVELKLAVPEGCSAAIVEHPAFRGPGVREAASRHELTTYFDTPDRTLARAGVSLRVRRTGERRVQTLKADRRGGIAADRAEWEWPVEQDDPDLGLLAQTPVGEKLPRRLELQPVFLTDIERITRVVRRDGGSVIEAAFDTGAIVAGQARDPVCELELELKAGDPASLYRLALELHATVPLTVESLSKAARGYRLRTGVAPSAQKAEDVGLRAKTSAAAAFRQILHTALGHLLANQPAALSGDPEGVHQMRVAIRRLRAALALFQPLLEPHTVSRFQAELRRVGRVFGEARDWDVFTLEVLPDALKAAGLKPWDSLLHPPAAERRQVAHHHFAAELHASPFTGLVLGLAAWAEEKTLLGGAELQRPIEALCPRLLDRLAEKVERRGRHLADCSDSERHALRKSLKKLRYGIDYVASLFPAQQVDTYLGGCRKLQKTLGKMNDAVTASVLMDQLVVASRPDLAPAAGALSEQFDRIRADELHKLSRRWKAFQAEPRFWR
ncbi:MAG TPA: CHAD domain-containing protein [Rhodopila sp.]